MLADLTEKLADIVEARRDIGLRLKEASRKERDGLLAQHREIKELEYQYGAEIAEAQLQHALDAGKAKPIELARSRLMRLRSRLQHADWLLWTRSIWRFKDMESDAKQGKHPAQFSAKVPERLIAMYTVRGETVLDPFVGSGTTCRVAKQLGRNSLGLDINPDYCALAVDLVSQCEDTQSTHLITVGDARQMDSVEDESVHLIIAHPPYWNCIKISDLADDLSNCDNDSYSDFLEQMRRVATECLRVLQPDRVAAFMIGDIMRKVDNLTRLFPLHSDFLTIAQQIGFVPWDVYIVETKMRDSGGMPMMGSYPYPHKIFSQFSHNYIVVLRKPPSD